MGAGPWLPVGVGWPGGCQSRLPSSGLERTPCQGKRGGGRVAERCTIGWATRAGGGVLALPFCFPRALTLGLVVLVMLVVRVVWAPEWMIVSVAALLARVVWALE